MFSGPTPLPFFDIVGRLKKVEISAKNDLNSGIWQRGILKSLAEYVQHRVCLVIVQSFLHENVIFSVCARMENAAYIIFIMWNSISGLDAWYHFRFIISCGVAVMGRGHQKKSGIFLRRGGAKNISEGRFNY